MKVTRIEIMKDKVYDNYTARIFLDESCIVVGNTCACSKGCNNTWCIPAIGSEFTNADSLYSYLEGGYYEKKEA